MISCMLYTFVYWCLCIKREMGNVLKQCIIMRLIVLALKQANDLLHFLTINRQASVICNQFLVFNIEYIAKRYFSKEWVSCTLACCKQLSCTIKPKFPTSSFIMLMAWCKHRECFGIDKTISWICSLHMERKSSVHRASLQGTNLTQALTDQRVVFLIRSWQQEGGWQSKQNHPPNYL